MKPIILGMCSAFVGEALSPDGSTSAGARLRALSGMSYEDYVKAFERRNLVAGTRWSAAAARAAGRHFRAVLARRRVVVCGRPVWAALGLPPVDWFASHENWTLIPHPSGRNRVYNERRTRQKARRVLRRLARGEGR